MTVGYKNNFLKYILKPTVLLIMVGFILPDLYSQEVGLKEDVHGITHVSVSHLVDSPQKLDIASLKVRLKGNTQSILGHYSIENKAVEFKPYWPLDKKLTYEVFWNDQLVKTIEPSDLIYKDKTEVLAIYPDVDSLPSNLLKVYIKFSNTMSEGQSSRYVTLLKNGIDTVHRAFLDLQPELWNRDKSILTLWMEPGRVKRDLGPNKMLGQALEVGQQYDLIISKRWKDASGLSLINDHVKKIKVAAADRDSPNINKWKIISPKSQTREKLYIEFDESMDFILANEVFNIMLDGKSIDGQVVVSSDGREWSFIPKGNWPAGEYSIKVDTKLEDMAGNNLNRLFDTDLKNDLKKRAGNKYETINFTIY